MKTYTQHGVTVHRVNARKHDGYSYYSSTPIHLFAYRIGKFTCWSTWELTQSEIDSGVKRLAENLAASAPTRTVKRAFEQALAGKTGLFKDQGGDAALMYSSPAHLELSENGRHVKFVAPCGETGYFTRLEAEKLVEALAS